MSSLVHSGVKNASIPGETEAKKAGRFGWPVMTDDEYLKAAEMQLWLSAFASNNPQVSLHASRGAGLG